MADEFGANVRLLGRARRGEQGKDLTGRVAREFEQMRGLSLSAAQATRLFSIDAPECERILDSLVDRGVLRRTDEGQYTPSSTRTEE